MQSARLLNKVGGLFAFNLKVARITRDTHVTARPIDSEVEIKLGRADT